MILKLLLLWESMKILQKKNNSNSFDQTNKKHECKKGAKNTKNWTERNFIGNFGFII